MESGPEQFLLIFQYFIIEILKSCDQSLSTGLSLRERCYSTSKLKLVGTVTYKSDFKALDNSYFPISAGTVFSFIDIRL